MNKQTSDERLLKLIENSGGENNKNPNPFRPKKPLFNLIPFKLNPLELKAKLTNLKINLHYLNRGLIALAILSTLVFIYALFSAPVIPKSDSLFFTSETPNSMIKLISGDGQDQVKKNLAGRNIKRDFFVPLGTKVNVEAVNQTQSLSELFKDFKLVGIFWSQNPEVMIENIKDTRTYSLKKGDSINEKIKVVGISRTSAILEAVTEEGPKEFELR